MLRGLRQAVERRPPVEPAGRGSPQTPFLLPIEFPRWGGATGSVPTLRGLRQSVEHRRHRAENPDPFACGGAKRGRGRFPTVSRVAALWHPGAYGESTMREMMRKIEAAAGALQVQLQLVEVRSASEFERAFLAMARERADALILLPSPMLFSERTYRRSRHKAPATLDRNGEGVRGTWWPNGLRSEHP